MALRNLWRFNRDILINVCNSGLQAFPIAWKTAGITPIPKPGGDFRPISLLSQLGKIVERIVARRCDFKLRITENQFGCRAGTTVDLVLYKFYHESILKDGELGAAIFFDLSKAFDRVNKFVVLEKLIDDCVDPWMVLFLNDFLTNRRFKVRYRNCEAEEGPMRLGIPQGSPLSPSYSNSILFPQRSPKGPRQISFSLMTMQQSLRPDLLEPCHATLSKSSTLSGLMAKTKAWFSTLTNRGLCSSRMSIMISTSPSVTTTSR